MMAMDETILETERLRLVMWGQDDLPLLHHLHSTIETTRYHGGAAPWSLEKCEERLARWREEYARDGTTKFKLMARSDGRFVGRAGFSFYGGERPDFEMGYALLEQEWGKGYATEIGIALRDWFFRKAFADRFIAFTHPDNVASQNVLAKIGMRPCEPMTIDGFVCPTFEYEGARRSPV